MPANPPAGASAWEVPWLDEARADLMIACAKFRSVGIGETHTELERVARLCFAAGRQAQADDATENRILEGLHAAGQRATGASEATPAEDQPVCEVPARCGACGHTVGEGPAFNHCPEVGCPCVYMHRLKPAERSPKDLSERVRRFRKHLSEGGHWTLHEHAELLGQVVERLREYEDLERMLSAPTPTAAARDTVDVEAPPGQLGELRERLRSAIAFPARNADLLRTCLDSIDAIEARAAAAEQQLAKLLKLPDTEQEVEAMEDATSAERALELLCAVREVEVVTVKVSTLRTLAQQITAAEQHAAALARKVETLETLLDDSVIVSASEPLMQELARIRAARAEPAAAPASAPAEEK